MSRPNPEYKPLHKICELLNALHIYTDSARENVTRYIEATHYCSHVQKDLRQCLIYDSPDKEARLIGVEYMIPKHLFPTLPDEEKKLWHSHDFEVKSGMLILPKPENADPDEWEKAEKEAMKEIVGLLASGPGGFTSPRVSNSWVPSRIRYKSTWTRCLQSEMIDLVLIIKQRPNTEMTSNLMTFTH